MNADDAKSTFPKRFALALSLRNSLRVAMQNGNRPRPDLRLRDSGSYSAQTEQGDQTALAFSLLQRLYFSFSMLHEPDSASFALHATTTRDSGVH